MQPLNEIQNKTLSPSNQVNQHYFFLSDEEWELFEERAAIMEYEGGLCREQAEKLALDRVLAQRSVFSIAG